MPFLALRSYLPENHPDKAKEIGSEATPADYLDTLLALTAEWRRLLAPHGSLAVELGDVYSGSGGGGGDYDDDGWRGGQPRFGGSASKARGSRWSVADALWFAGVIDTEGSIIVHRQDRGGNSPSYRTDVCVSMMDREVCDRAAEIAGVGNVNRDGRNVYSWHVTAQQARYVLTNIWPHLLIKKRQAMAAIELQRHIEEHRGRGRYNPLTGSELDYREMIRQYVSGLNARGEDRGKYVPTWTPPAPPRVKHQDRRSVGWPLPKSLCGIPTLYPICLAYGINVLTGDPSPAGRWRIRNLKPWIRSCPPVGALGDKERPATSYITVACIGRDRWFDLDAVRTHSDYDCPNLRCNGARATDAQVPGQRHNASDHTTNPGGAPPLDWWHHVDAIIDAEIDARAGKGANRRTAKDVDQQARTGKSGDRDGNWGSLPELGETNGAVGARGVHIRRALERAGILTTLDAYDVSPKGYTGSHYAVFPMELVRLLIDEMAPRRVCVTCGQPSRRIVGEASYVNGRTGQPATLKPERWRNGGEVRNKPGGDSVNQSGASGHDQNAIRIASTLGWSDCECGKGPCQYCGTEMQRNQNDDWCCEPCGRITDHWRPGRILDPFVGSGTTLAVASGMGRDSVGIDLDERNADLCQERVGMFLEIDYPDQEVTA